jgi:hypothetical protein
MKAALIACCLALASAASAGAQSYDPYRGIICPASGCSPEDIAYAHAQEAARQADLEQRYKEQQALAVPVTKADLMLVCGSDTINIWFGAGLLTWGGGRAPPSLAPGSGLGCRDHLQAAFRV